MTDLLSILTFGTKRRAEVKIGRRTPSVNSIHSMTLRYIIWNETFRILWTTVAITMGTKMKTAAWSDCIPSRRNTERWTSVLRKARRKRTNSRAILYDIKIASKMFSWSEVQNENLTYSRFCKLNSIAIIIVIMVVIFWTGVKISDCWLYSSAYPTFVCWFVSTSREWNRPALMINVATIGSCRIRIAITNLKSEYAALPYDNNQ